MPLLGVISMRVTANPLTAKCSDRYGSLAQVKHSVASRER